MPDINLDCALNQETPAAQANIKQSGFAIFISQQSRHAELEKYQAERIEFGNNAGTQHVFTKFSALGNVVAKQRYLVNSRIL
ncbi:MAG TPA: hypothetical protein DCS89_18750 [Gammaproteobacteria bacterium]|nr:hypothetical protein [Gammaproteobacteria bacterium]HAT29062.1 hypothetical protein [Gammaproteobacteria bacterium]